MKLPLLGTKNNSADSADWHACGLTCINVNVSLTRRRSQSQTSFLRAERICVLAYALPASRGKWRSDPPFPSAASGPMGSAAMVDLGAEKSEEGDMAVEDMRERGRVVRVARQEQERLVDEETHSHAAVLYIYQSLPLTWARWSSHFCIPEHPRTRRLQLSSCLGPELSPPALLGGSEAHIVDLPMATAFRSRRMRCLRKKAERKHASRKPKHQFIELDVHPTPQSDRPRLLNYQVVSPSARRVLVMTAVVVPYV